MPSKTTGRARELRRNCTDAERALWRGLCRRQLAGHRFRRQYPVGPYIVDFVCLSAGLVIEVDGGQHAEDEAYDRRRDAYLRSEGFEVIRYWNHHVLQQRERVLEDIYRHLGGRV